MALLRFEVSKRAYNLMLNGLRYYMDKSGAVGLSHVEYALEDISMYSFVTADNINVDTKEIKAVGLSCSSRTLDIALTLSDWYGKASADPEYQVDYTEYLFEKYEAYRASCEDIRGIRVDPIGSELRRQNEKRQQLLEDIRQDWYECIQDADESMSKSQFARAYDYPYTAVLVALCERDVGRDMS